jgi:hypothetical protein
MIFYAAA